MTIPVEVVEIRYFSQQDTNLKSQFVTSSSPTVTAEKEGNMEKVKIDLLRIERSIRLIRGDKVILDEDLAELYGVETKISTGFLPTSCFS